MRRADVPRAGTAEGDVERDAVERLLDGRLQFQFAYQPIVDLKRGAVTGYEALARFPAEIGLRPDEVFQMAGRYGLRAELEGCTALRALQERVKLPPNCFLTVNAGPVLLLSEKWDEVLREAGDLDAVVIEVTEDEPVADYPGLRDKLDRIRELGGHVAVDDTGTGYASLKHVMELRPNFIKLDRFFVGGCHREPARAAMIEMLGNVASRLDAWIVAEGVESVEELEELMKLGVPLAQGFYLGRPDAEMVELPEAMGKTLRERALALVANDLQRILDRCVSCAEELEAQALLEADPQLRLVALTDGWGRPVGLVERHPVAGWRTLVQPMKVQMASEVREVLQRALTRPLETRFDPITVTNEQGQLQGVVLADRLMRLALEPRTGPTEMEIVDGVVRPKRSGRERRSGWK